MTCSTLDRMLSRAIRSAAAPPPRSRVQWIQEEVFIPDGPFKGERFRFDRQPVTRLLLEEMDRDTWPEVFVVGPSQAGKTLVAHVAPIVYVIAELRRNCVVGVPDGKMVADKWSVDIRPVFAASPTLRQLLPRSGPGSHGGTVRDFVAFRNGAVLRFMTAGGDDVGRAGFTAEGGVFVTEAARWSHAGESSREAPPLEQLKARMQATRRQQRRLVVEGTSTTDDELPWSAHADSTQSRIVGQCPHCRAWVTPEREHLVGWHDAPTELDAAESAWWACPGCGQEITTAQRRKMNAGARLVHAGQSIDQRGRVSGSPPRTERLFFRWSMFHNQLLDARDVAPDEWKAARLDPESEQRHAAEKKLCQFVWARPWTPPDLVIDALQVGDVASRATELPAGELPADTEYLSIGADCGMYAVHWVAIAWRANRTGHVVDYQTIGVVGKQDADTAVERRDAVETKLIEALDTLAERCAIGWSNGSGGRKGPDRVLIDAGWLADLVHGWCRRRGSPFFPAIGRGTGQRAGHHYAHPGKKTNVVRFLGSGYHVTRSSKHRTLYFVADADEWKSAIHRALRVDAEHAGALTLYRDQQYHHRTFERHLTAETPEVVTHKRHGRTERWANPGGKPNHYFDATYLAAVGGHHAGFRLVDPRAIDERGPVAATPKKWWKG